MGIGRLNCGTAELAGLSGMLLKGSCSWAGRLNTKVDEADISPTRLGCTMGKCESGFDMVGEMRKRMCEWFVVGDGKSGCRGGADERDIEGGR